jgi:hypothetical protein
MKMLKGHKIVLPSSEHLEGNFHCNFHIHNTDMRFSLALAMALLHTLFLEKKEKEKFLLTPRLPRLNEI